MKKLFFTLLAISACVFGDQRFDSFKSKDMVPNSNDLRSITNSLVLISNRVTRIESGTNLWNTVTNRLTIPNFIIYTNYQNSVNSNFNWRISQLVTQTNGITLGEAEQYFLRLDGANVNGYGTNITTAIGAATTGELANAVSLLQSNIDITAYVAQSNIDIVATNLANHTNDLSNPHQVTAAQAGALSLVDWAQGTNDIYAAISSASYTNLNLEILALQTGKVSYTDAVYTTTVSKASTALQFEQDTNALAKLAIETNRAFMAEQGLGASLTNTQGDVSALIGNISNSYVVVNGTIRCDIDGMNNFRPTFSSSITNSFVTSIYWGDSGDGTNRWNILGASFINGEIDTDGYLPPFNGYYSYIGNPTNITVEFHPGTLADEESARIADDGLIITNLTSVSNRAYLSITNGQKNVDGSGFTNVNASLLNGFTAQQLSSVGATYYTWGSLAGAFTNPPTRLAQSLSPVNASAVTTTYTAVTNGQMLGGVCINTNELPRILTSGTIHFYTVFSRTGNSQIRTAKVVLSVYESNQSTIVTNLESETFEIMAEKTTLHTDVFVPMDITITDSNRLIVLRTVLVSGWGGETISAYSQDGNLSRIELPTSEGVYASKYYVDQMGSTKLSTNGNGFGITNLNAANLTGNIPSGVTASGGTDSNSIVNVGQMTAAIASNAAAGVSIVVNLTTNKVTGYSFAPTNETYRGDCSGGALGAQATISATVGATGVYFLAWGCTNTSYTTMAAQQISGDLYISENVANSLAVKVEIYRIDVATGTAYEWGDGGATTTVPPGSTPQLIPFSCYVPAVSTNAFYIFARLKNVSGTASTAIIGAGSGYNTHFHTELSSALYVAGKLNLNGDNIGTNAAAFRAAIGVESSVFPSLKSWLDNPIYSTGLGIIGDSTGAGSAWPLAMYGYMVTNYPNLTLRFWQLNTANTNMDLLYERIGSSGLRGLSWSNSTVFTDIPNYATATNEMDISVKATLSNWSNSISIEQRPIGGGYQNGSIDLNVGLIYFTYATSPTTQTNFSLWVNSGSSAYQISNGATMWIRVTALGSNAVTGKAEFKGYQSADGTNWTLRQFWTNAPPVTFLTNGTQIYAASTATNKQQGIIHQVVWRDAINGQDLMPPLDQWTYSVPQNVVATGSVSLTFWNGSWSGFKSDPVNTVNLDGWTNTLVKKCLPYYLSEVIENSGLNDTINSTSPKYRSTYQHMANLTASITSAVPQAGIVVLTQSPVSPTNNYVRSMGINAQHQATAAKQMGLGVIDTYGNFIKLNGTNDVTYDGTHPSWGQQMTNGAYIFDRIFK